MNTKQQLTKTCFVMPSPNQDCNDEDMPLDFLNVSTGNITRRITDDPYFQPTSEEPYQINSAWDGWLFTDMLRESPVVADLLDTLWIQDWPHSDRKKLTSTIQKFFHSQYFQRIESLRDTAKQKFFKLCPDYTELGGIVPAFDTTTELEKRIAIRSFDSALPIVVQWAMCNFSRYRQYWARGEVAKANATSQPLNITAQVLTEEENNTPITEKPRRSIVKQAQQLAQRKRKELTPEERRAGDLRKEVMRAYRAGKISEQTLIDLEIL